MKAYIGSGVLKCDKCGADLYPVTPGFDTNLTCFAAKCSNYEVEFKRPTIELEEVKKDGTS